MSDVYHQWHWHLTTVEISGRLDVHYFFLHERLWGMAWKYTSPDRSIYRGYTLLKSDVTRRDHVVRCRGSRGGGGGGHSTFMWEGGAAGGRKPDPVAMRSVHKIYTLSQYTLLKKKIIYIPCRNIAPSLVPRSQPVIKILGWEALKSDPVINGVAR